MAISLETQRVMVIDDNDFVRETVFAMLTEVGFRHIAQAKEGNDALRQLEAADPDIIICDISMKPMDGLEFVAALREHAWPRAAQVPVIFLTVHTEAAIVKQAAKLGVKAYVVKPVQKKQLEARVVTVLEAARMQRPHSVA
jgi:two-component system chemotaxis response regulator CheY